ncbi:CRISPR-associated endoribonuclease Cas2 [Endomicrobiia bacterium]|nr:CRISPR-associated endonuclease Cas2 [Candidatus Endomicrobium trichonymphae]GHT04340.1 CRISPR-associated endoribonuclease Cas2 [Endomicrobiia bacterium]GHT13114.1 CRISPR-associated endoribonuclease Cas2 [Endomicrobiia bacterium]GHT15377.1 CRISPR-associated endoribonuclease Cas2 [Endomicrobiia bacterium]GHT21628.1 CRISPR-associated endoribonuclease Cas2 [Endomicrobiia bacterium]GHT25251.1 CRISPR-associated endoribonuclease Cas2 [Endomicrobiia bacterium]
MWVLIAFDLPVLTQKQRRIASSFREYLKNIGFIMLQKSIYCYYACTKERSDSVEKDIKKHIPDNGHISVLFLTDRMFSMTKNYYGKLKVDISQPELFDNLL